MEERRIIARFRSEEDLHEFNKLNDLELTKDVKEVHISDIALPLMKFKKPSKKKPRERKEWEDHWVGMPTYNMDFALDEYCKIDFYFDKEFYDSARLSEVFTQNISDKTKSVWAPKPIVRGAFKDLRVVTPEVEMKLKYPMFVVSKGRTTKELWHSSFSLSQCGIDHYLVVEPQEKEMYEKNFGDDKHITILELDMTYKEKYDFIDNYGKDVGVGPGAARNFCMDYSKNVLHAKKCWIIDDNIDCYDTRINGRRLLTRSAIPYVAVEKFVDRYDNVALAGLNYTGFVVGTGSYPAFTTNTRIYSMTLFDLELCPYQRGNYNEDTICSLDVLDEGLCTVQFNMFTGEKLTTQKKRGGNSEEFYDKNGTNDKSQLLVDVYPQYAKLKYKFHRAHHEVDYSVFKQKLHLKEDVDLSTLPKVDDMGIKIIQIPREWYNTEKDTTEYLNEHWKEFKEYDINTLFMPGGTMIQG